MDDVRTAIKAELVERRMTQADLAKIMGRNPSNASRLLDANGRDIPVGLVLLAEESLGLPRGTFFIRAGLVDLPTTTEEAILADPRLNSAGARQAVLDMLTGVAASERPVKGSRRHANGAS